MAVVTLHDVPGNHIDSVPFDAVSDAGATNYIALWYVPFNCYVTTVTIMFTDTVTGADTNTFNLNLDDNDRSTELGNKDFTSGVNGTAGTEVTLYAPTAPGKSLTAGNKLYLERELAGTGLNMPEGIMIVTYKGR